MTPPKSFQDVAFHSGQSVPANPDGHPLTSSTVLKQCLRAIGDNIREAIMIVDENLVLRQVNPAAARLCHLPGGLLGHSLKKQSRGCFPKIVGILSRVINEGASVPEALLVCPVPDSEPEMETKGKGKKKKHRDETHNLEVRVLATPLLGSNGHCVGALLVVREHTLKTTMAQSGRGRNRFHRMIGATARMREIYALIEALSKMETTVLITGESGTGKELVAEALHNESTRSHGPLVKVNCSALSETILESELFGHVKGAFTGAIRDRVGRFQMADKGTIFLDEIGDTSLNMQTRLLRTIQEKELERVGDSRTVKVDVRIVTATNRDLKEKVKSNRFREDLFFRLKVVEIHLPPLRDRRSDIPLLIAHFIQKFNTKYDKHIADVAHNAMELLMHHSWPGNVRELENVMEHAFVLCRQNQIRVRHLPKDMLKARPCADPHPPPPPPPPTANSEEESIRRALETAHWKKKKAAKLLGISRSTFYRKLEKYGIT